MIATKGRIFILFYFVQSLLVGQDTLYKRSGETIAAKILEINIKEVSYKRSDLLDGPLVIVSKNEILKIKYATGQVDSFTVVIPPVQKQVVKTYERVYVNPEWIKLSMRRGVYIYQNHNISDRRVFYLVNKRDVTENSKEVYDNILASKKNKIVQYAVGYGGTAFGIACLIGSAVALGDNSTNSNILLGLTLGSIGAGAIVSSQIVSFSYKLKRIKHADKVVELYNQTLK